MLLADCTSSNETLSINDNVIISLNGHVLTFDGSTLTANDLTKDFGVIGTTSGSKLVCQNKGCINSYGNTYLVGGEIEAKDTSALLKTYDYVYSKTSTPKFNGHPSEVIIYGINGSGNTSVDGNLCTHYMLQPSYLFYGHCNFKYTITGSATNGRVIDITTGATNMTAAKKASAEFRNCDIYHADTGNASGDNTNSAIHMSGTHLHMLVDGCNISGENNAFQQSDATVYITKSVLSGGIHGGIYTTQGGGVTPYGRNLNDIAHGQVYITDSTLAKRATTKTGQNYYACYFGYGTNVVCDGVKFLDADGNLYTPAIKDGSGLGLNTEVSLSNCELKSVRCDSGCTVNLGRGISDDVKNASVSGTKNLTEDVYRYDLVLDM